MDCKVERRMNGDEECLEVQIGTWPDGAPRTSLLEPVQSGGWAGMHNRGIYLMVFELAPGAWRGIMAGKGALVNADGAPTPEQALVDAWGAFQGA